MAVLGYQGSISLSFATFSMFWQSFLNDSVMIYYWWLSLFNIGCFSFYSVTLGSRSTTNSPPPLGLPRYHSPCCSSPSDDWFFPCFSEFPSFGVVSPKASCWPSILGCLWRADLQSLFLQCFHTFTFSGLAFWLPFLFVIFPKWAKSFPAKSKVFSTTSP